MIVGQKTVGTATAVGADTARVSRVSLASSSVVPDVRVYLDGLGSPGAGAATVKLVARDSAGTLVATGVEATVADGEAASWRTLEWSSTLTLPAGDYDIGIHVGGSGVVRSYVTDPGASPLTSSSTVTVANVITDSTRAAGPDGDGRSADLTTGIWQSTQNLTKNSDASSGMTNWAAFNYVVVNLQTNGTFESSPITTNWSASSGSATISRDTVTFRTGTASAKVVVTDAAGIRNTGIAFTSGQGYAAEAYVNAPNGTAMVIQLVRADFSTVVAQQTFTGNGAFQKVQVAASTWPATETGYLFIKTTATGVGATFYVDDVVVVNGSTVGYLSSSASTVTQLTTTGLTVGGGYGVRYTVTAAGGWGAYFANSLYNYWSGWSPASQFDTASTYTLSFYARVQPGTTTPVSVKISDGTSTNIVWAGGTFSPPNDGVTWQRFSFTFTPAVAGNQPIVFFNLNNISTSLGTLDVTGLQLEKKSYATPTVRSSSTSFGVRSAGRAQVSTTLIDTTRGWYFGRVRVSSTMTAGFATGAGPTIASMATTSGTENILLYYRAASGDWRMRSIHSGGSTGDATKVTAHVAGDKVGVGGYWDQAQNKIGVSVNGSAWSLATPAGWPALSGSVAFDIGSNVGGSQLDGDLIWFAYGRGTLSNADVAALHAFGDTVPTLGQLPGNPVFVWAGSSTSYVTNRAGQTYSDTYSDGPATSVTVMLPGDEQMAMFFSPVTPYAPPAGETEIYYARLPFLEAQAKLGENVSSVSDFTPMAGDVTWHGSRVDSERGSVCVAQVGSEFEDLVGCRVRLTPTGVTAAKSVIVFIHNTSDRITAPLSLPRRVFMQIADPVETSVRVVVERLT